MHAEPVLQEFERRSGIRVRAVYDVEASKATGLANRIAAEKSRPQADVFWNGEFVQTLRLQAQGALAVSKPSNGETLPGNLRDSNGFWYACGGRFRVILVHNRLSHAARPLRWEDLSSDLALALPLFGTSADQAAALYAVWGTDRAQKLYEQAKARGARVVAGNSVVRDLVAQGTVSAGWTDSDDACGALAQGAPVTIVLPDQQEQGTLLVPGTVAQIAGAPHPAQALALIDYLLDPATEKTLIERGYFQVSVRPGGAVHPCVGAPSVKTMPVRLEAIAAHLEGSRRDLTAIFGQ
jgi:iron(III) transport system substrate-binding protein